MQNQKYNLLWEGQKMREVYGTIRKLGATSKYKGYYFVAEAIRMTMEFQERPMKITKDIYPKLARAHQKSVGRDPE